MTVHAIVRLVAGGLVPASTIGGLAVHPGFFAVTLFVGANLLQSSFTGTCPLIAILRRAGVPEGEATMGAEGGHRG